MEIAIVYTGERRFEKQGRENHRLLWQELSEFISFKIIDKCKDNRDNDQFQLSGPNQIWDFYKAIENIEEDIIIKMRTDIWFAKSSIPYIVNDILSVVNNQKDFILLGSELYNHYDVNYKTYPTFWPQQKKGKTTDFLLVTRKDALRYKDEIYKELSLEQSKSGNILWQRIKQPDKRGFFSCGQIYLLRNEYKSKDDYYIAYQFSQHYGKKTKKSTQFYYERISSNK